MNNKVLKKLEYDKIKYILKEEAVSRMGQKKCENLNPITDFIETQRLLNETSEAVNIIFEKETIPLGGIKDISKYFQKIYKGGVLTAEELLNIADTLYVFDKVYKFAYGEDKEKVYEFINNLFKDVKRQNSIKKEIEKCILSKEEIADNASNELLRIRRNIKKSSESIKSKLNSMVNSNQLSDKLQDSIVTMRSGRYCIPIKQKYKNDVKGIVHDQSSTGATVFIEPQSVVNLNNKIKELEVNEKEEIKKILKKLTKKVGEKIEEIEVSFKAIGKLDFIFAKAKLALKMNATLPKLNKKRYVNIKKGRHPLIEEDEVVPIDIKIGKEFNSLIITGPNTGGKTVSLKTLGLFVLMTQSGLFIPAKSNSEIGIFKEVFADIGDEQSIEQNLSTFSSHMTNIISILENVTKESLVLFDELGAGTDPVEGAALAISIIDKLHNQNIRVAATTHYSELKVYALRKKGVMNASCEFDVKTLKPTYKLLMGIPGKSNAFEISKRLGLKDDIIDKAKETLSNEERKFEDVITDLEISKRNAEKEKEKVNMYKEEIEELKNNLKEEKDKIKKEKEEIINKANKEAREVIKKSKKEADKLIKQLNKEIREMNKTIDTSNVENIRQDLRDKLSEKEAKIKIDENKKKVKKIEGKLKKGDSVYVPKFDKNGTVKTLPDKRGNLVVKIGILDVNVNIKNIGRGREDKGTVKHKYIPSQNRKINVKSISNEINVIGENSLSAVSKVDKFIDDSFVAGLKSVRIVHGKGAGILRNKIHKYLKTNKHVKDFTIAGYYDGGSGATLVELK